VVGEDHIERDFVDAGVLAADRLGDYCSDIFG
jgi:hypothetical protein